MRMAKRAAWFLSMGGLSGLLAFAAQSQDLSRSERWALAQACRADINTLCAGIRPGGGAIAECLKSHAPQVSEGCRTVIGSAMKGRDRSVTAQPAPSGTLAAPEFAQSVLHRDVAYGHHAKQTMDIYVPPGAKGAPVIFMVHGGAWTTGSKSAARVVENKLKHWLPKGFIVISVDNRLLPEADPLVQAQDVAQALATAQQKVAGLGGDPRRFVLMGHSAGAHLVSLLSADPAMATRLGAQPWRGTVALDSAAYDVTEIMKAPHMRLYDRAFGSDPAFWQRVSPSWQLHSGTQPMLLVCSSNRRESCAQAEAFERKANSVGVQAEVFPLAKSHAAINQDLGQPGAYTERVDRFLDAVLR